MSTTPRAVQLQMRREIRAAGKACAGPEGWEPRGLAMAVGWQLRGCVEPILAPPEAVSEHVAQMVGRRVYELAGALVEALEPGQDVGRIAARVGISIDEWACDCEAPAEEVAFSRAVAHYVCASVEPLLMPLEAVSEHVAQMIGRRVHELAEALREVQIQVDDGEADAGDLVAALAAQLGVDLAARFDPRSPGEFCKEGGAA